MVLWLTRPGQTMARGPHTGQLSFLICPTDVEEVLSNSCILLIPHFLYVCFKSNFNKKCKYCGGYTSLDIRPSAPGPAPGPAPSQWPQQSSSFADFSSGHEFDVDVERVATLPNAVKGREQKHTVPSAE